MDIRKLVGSLGSMYDDPVTLDLDEMDKEVDLRKFV